MNNTKHIASGFSNPELQNKIFLSPKDLMELTGVGESLIYKYLNDNPPFRTERIGKKIVIFANSFWRWYNGEVTS